MIGCLPTTLTVAGKEMQIRSDYRVALTIFEAFEDDELTSFDKVQVLLKCLYVDEINPEDEQEACEQAVWYLNCGDTVDKPQTSKPLYSWQQDEQMIFSAINKVAGKEVRCVDYLHFWSFLGLFNEIGDGTFSTVVSIRQKKQKGKKLEKWEQEYYSANKDKVDLKRKYTENDKINLEALDEILGL